MTLEDMKILYVVDNPEYSAEERAKYVLTGKL